MNLDLLTNDLFFHDWSVFVSSLKTFSDVNLRRASLYTIQFCFIEFQHSPMKNLMAHLIFVSLLLVLALKSSFSSLIENRICWYYFDLLF